MSKKKVKWHGYDVVEASLVDVTYRRLFIKTLGKHWTDGNWFVDFDELVDPKMMEVHEKGEEK